MRLPRPCSSLGTPRPGTAWPFCRLGHLLFALWLSRVSIRSPASSLRCRTARSSMLRRPSFCRWRKWDPSSWVPAPLPRAAPSLRKAPVLTCAAAHSGFVLVAGGLGERLGYNGIKISLPLFECERKSFIQIYIEHILEMQVTCLARAGGWRVARAGGRGFGGVGGFSRCRRRGRRGAGGGAMYVYTLRCSAWHHHKRGRHMPTSHSDLITGLHAARRIRAGPCGSPLRS